MAARTPEDLALSPCKFALNQIPAQSVEVNENGQTVKKIKKLVQKLDENGQPLFEIKEQSVKRGCGCKGKKQKTEVVKKKVPVMEEIWVEESIDVIQKASTEDMVVCKLYGRIKKSFCCKCSTYKKKR